MDSSSPKNTQSAPLLDLIDRERTAQMLGVSPRTLDRWHLLRQGPPRIGVGRKVRYRRAAIEQWLLSRETTGCLNARR